MSMKGSEWQKEISKLSKADREKYAKAIGTILEWDTFEEHYGWTGLGTIKFFLQEEK